MTYVLRPLFALLLLLLAGTLPATLSAQSSTVSTYSSPRVVFQYPAAWGQATSVLVPDCRLEHPTDKPDGVSPGHAAIFFRGAGPVTAEDLKRCRVPDFSRAQVRVFPLLGWKRRPEKGADLFKGLEDLLRVRKAERGDPVPFIPFIDAHPAFTEHVRVAPVIAGSGVGFVTQWMIEPDSIGARLVYVFQAVSTDRRVYVLATFPLRTAVRLPEFLLIPGEPLETTDARYRAYAAQIAETVRAAKPEDFTPSLKDVLDLCLSLDLR